MPISPIRCSYLQYGLYGTIELQNSTVYLQSGLYGTIELQNSTVYLQSGLYGTIERQNSTVRTVWQLAKCFRPLYVCQVLVFLRVLSGFRTPRITR
jgi:hypothetical protein